MPCVSFGGSDFGNFRISGEARKAISDRCYLDAQKVSEARWFEENKEYEKSINKWRDVFGPFFPVYG